MMTSRIEEYLDELFNEPKCELNYTKDYELLIAIMLSAQSTDKRVNSVTPILFEKYPSLSDLKNADIADLEEIIRSVGSFRKKSLYIKGISRMLDEECGGVVPTDREYLHRLLLLIVRYKPSIPLLQVLQLQELLLLFYNLIPQ